MVIDKTKSVLKSSVPVTLYDPSEKAQNHFLCLLDMEERLPRPLSAGTEVESPELDLSVSALTPRGRGGRSPLPIYPCRRPGCRHECRVSRASRPLFGKVSLSNQDSYMETMHIAQARQ